MWSTWHKFWPLHFNFQFAKCWLFKQENHKCGRFRASAIFCVHATRCLASESLNPALVQNLKARLPKQPKWVDMLRLIETARSELLSIEILVVYFHHAFRVAALSWEVRWYRHKASNAGQLEFRIFLYQSIEYNLLQSAAKGSSRYALPQNCQ